MSHVVLRNSSNNKYRTVAGVVGGTKGGGVWALAYMLSVLGKRFRDSGKRRLY